ncbi:hypothetical protein [Halobacteriovorax sp.]|uniref:hypothetical protein n=1 Tax=Halobacteriovorax sp. TaxID=2020862 RepID=UPI003565EAE4
MKKFILIIFTLFISYSAIAGSVSNKLPLGLVEQLYEMSLWQDSFDESGTVENIELNNFLNGLNAIEADIPSYKVVDNMFGSEGTYNHFSNLYSVKVQIIRYLRDVNIDEYSRDKVKLVNSAWKTRYVNSFLSLVKLSKITGLKEIAQAFEKKLNNGDLTIIDLSPDARKLLARESSHHEDNLLAKTNKRFNVSGVYIANRKLFAIDFARDSIEETIITFVHEMIHAADPALDNARKSFIELLPKAKNILQKWTGNSEIVSEINLNFLDNVFFEGDDNHLNKFYNEKNENTLRDLSAKLDVDTLPDHEVAIVKEWIGAALRLSVFNEYHAYGKSLQFLKELIVDFNIVKGKVSTHKKLIEQFIHGDDLFVAKLAMASNPFSNLKIYALRYKKDKEYFNSFRKLINYLEYLFLLEIKETVNLDNDRYSKYLSSLVTDDEETLTEIRQTWNQVEDIETSLNPYELITSRLTNATIVKIKKNLGLITNSLDSNISKLQTTTAGVLDLHDVSDAELKLIGIQWSGSPFQRVDDSVKAIVESSLEEISIDIKKYFELMPWSEDIYFKNRGLVYIQGDTVSQKLLKLNVLRTSLWIDHSFSAWTDTVLGARVLLEKIRSEVYFSSEEISDTRAQQIEEALIVILEGSGNDHDKINQLTHLFENLIKLHSNAEDEDMPEIAKSLFSKIAAIRNALQRVGVHGTKKISAVKEDLLKSQERFNAQLIPYVEYCSDKSLKILNGQGQLNSNAKFNTDSGKEFNMMLTCYNNELYAVRQPNDFTDYMTTTFTSEGKLAAKIFKGSRKILISPVKVKKKKKRSWFSF